MKNELNNFAKKRGFDLALIEEMRSKMSAGSTVSSLVNYLHQKKGITSMLKVKGMMMYAFAITAGDIRYLGVGFNYTTEYKEMMNDVLGKRILNKRDIWDVL